MTETKRLLATLKHSLECLKDRIVACFGSRPWEFLLTAHFAARTKHSFFAHGRLTASAEKQFQAKLRRLRQDFSDLHQESLCLPQEQRHGTGLLLAIREWEPQGFEALPRT
jgi:hypothetical protein